MEHPMDVLTQVDIATFVVFSALFLVVLALPVVAAVRWLAKHVKRGIK